MRFGRRSSSGISSSGRKVARSTVVSPGSPAISAALLGASGVVEHAVDRTQSKSPAQDRGGAVVITARRQMARGDWGSSPSAETLLGFCTLTPEDESSHSAPATRALIRRSLRCRSPRRPPAPGEGVEQVRDPASSSLWGRPAAGPSAQSVRPRTRLVLRFPSLATRSGSSAYVSRGLFNPLL